jgi:hypothetical protein
MFVVCKVSEHISVNISSRIFMLVAKVKAYIVLVYMFT